MKTLLDLLSEKPSTKEELSWKLAISERAVRKQIEKLRLQGYPIMSSSHTKGYWLGDEKDWQQLRRELLSRINHYYKLIKAMDNYAKENYQMSIDDYKTGRIYIPFKDSSKMSEYEYLMAEEEEINKQDPRNW